MIDEWHDAQAVSPLVTRANFLLPASPRYWLPEDHLVHFAMGAVAALEISVVDRFFIRQRTPGEGEHGIHG